MKKLILVIMAIAVPVLASDHASPKVETMSKAEIEGEIFKRPDVYKATEDGNTTLEVMSFLSSDEHFGSGMYKSEAVRYEIDEPYGVDEFMYFLEGGVTLTSSDGTIQVIGAGEAVTIPKEWTGTWETDGYVKIWVSYSEDKGYFK